MRGTLIILVAACLLVLAGCASGQSQPQAEDAGAFVGSWELYDIDYKDDRDDIDHQTYLDLVELMDWRVMLDLNEEGAASIVSVGTVSIGSWEPAGSDAITIVLSGETIAASLADGMLCMDVEDARLRFEKVSDTPSVRREAVDPAGIFADEESERAYVATVEQVRAIDVSICDSSSCTVRAYAIGEDFEGDPGILLEIANKTDDIIYLVNEDDFTVNGAPVEAVLMRVIPGSYTSKAFLYFPGDDAPAAGDIVSVTGTISVFDAEENLIGSWEVVL